MYIFSKDLIINQYDWYMQNIPGYWRGGCNSAQIKKYQIVGQGNYLLSSDGKNWVKYEVPNTSSFNFESGVSPWYVSDVIVGDNILAVGSFTSGLWDYFLETQGANWFSVAYGNNKYVAVGSPRAVAYATPVNPGQNLTWTIATQKTGIDASPAFVEYFSSLGKFIAGGQQYFSYSTNGTSWTSGGQIFSDSTISIEGIATNGTIYVIVASKVVGSGTTYIVTSTDGLNWSQPTSIIGLAGKSIAYHNGRWLIAGYQPTAPNGGMVAESNDLTNWEKTSIAADSTTYGFNVVIPGDTGWIVAGKDYVGFREY